MLVRAVRSSYFPRLCQSGDPSVLAGMGERPIAPRSAESESSIYRPCHHRRRRQRLRHRARCRRARLSASCCARRATWPAPPRRLDQADPRRAALPRILRIPAGARGADRARGAVGHRAAYHLAVALRAAASQGLRPAWMLRLGLFLYDHLGGRKLLPPTRDARLRRDRRRAAEAGYQRGFAYSDCWVDDARLVVLNARDAARSRRRRSLTRTRCVGGATPRAAAGRVDAAAMP